MELFKIDFKAMLMAGGKTEAEAQAMIEAHDKKVAEKVANGGTSYPAFLK